MDRRCEAVQKACRCFVLILGLTLALATPLHGDSVSLNIQVPPFLIPFDGSGTLTVFSDGRGPLTSGFNALGTQGFYLGGNSTSTGSLTLNLYFSGYPLADPNFASGGATIQFEVDDLDFLPDQSPKITLTETAVLRAVNGNYLETPINLADYQPEGSTDTDDERVLLAPMSLPSIDYTSPLVLSFQLTATVKNSGSSPVYLVNGPESLRSNLNLTLTPTVTAPVALPLPSTLLLLGAGALAMVLVRRRF